MGRRAGEATIALALALSIVFLFARHRIFSVPVLVGFLIGVIAPYLTGLVGMAITTETLLMIILSMGVETRDGVGAFGMEMVGYVVFGILKAVVVGASRRIVFRANR